MTPNERYQTDLLEEEVILAAEVERLTAKLQKVRNLRGEACYGISVGDTIAAHKHSWYSLVHGTVDHFTPARGKEGAGLWDIWIRPQTPEHPRQKLIRIPYYADIQTVIRMV